MPLEHSPWQPDRLAYWYLRLNGFLTIETFYVHPDSGPNALTEVDIVAARFAHRRENPLRQMEDDALALECPTIINVVLAEVTRGRCKLNGPWSRPESGNMQRVLSSVGCVPQDEIDHAADLLYAKRYWRNELTTVRLVAFGDRTNPELDGTDVRQITWNSVLNFCVKRFNAYRSEKSDIRNWTPDGKRLRELALNEHADWIRLEFGLN